MLIDFTKIEKLIPQRYPFLLIDKIIEYVPQSHLVAVKNTTADEWATNNEKITFENYPETLLIEGAAQSAAAFFYLEFLKGEDNRIVLLGKVSAEFFEPVKLSSQIIYRTSTFKVLKNGGFIEILVAVDDIKVAEVKIFCGF